MASPSGYDPRAFPPVAVTVDIAVFTVEDDVLKVALIERGQEPHAGRLALPGGFIRPDEDLHEAAVRELHEETGLEAHGHLQQFGAYGAPDRDPRMRIVSIGFWAIVPRLEAPTAGTDAAAAQTAPVDEILANPDGLAFDHHEILRDALEHARDALEETTVAADFCDEEFAISDLRKVYEAVWGTTLDQGNFQNKVLEIEGFVEPTGRRRSGGQGRPPELFRAGPARRIDPPIRRQR